MKNRLFTKVFVWLFGVALFLTPVLVYAKESNFVRNLKRYTKHPCWFCDMFDGLFDALNDVITILGVGMQSTFLALLGLGLAFYLAFRVGRAMFSITGDADTKLVPEILTQSIKVGFAAILIATFPQFFDYSITPLLKLSIGIGNRMTMTQLQGYTQQAARETNRDTGQVIFSEKSICEKLTIALQKEMYGRPAGDMNAFTEGTKESFLCYIRTGSVAMMTGIAVGSTLIAEWSDLGVWGMFSHLQLLGIGLELMVVFFILFIMFPLQLLDPIVKLGFICALMPLWITLWAFKVTSKYATDKAWNMFVNVMANLIIISVLSVIVISMMNQALGSPAERRELFQALLNGTANASYFEGTEGVSFGLVGKATLFTAALGYLAIKLFGQNEELAKQFADGVSLGLSSGATSLAAKGGGMALKGAKSLDSALAHAAEGAATGDGAMSKVASGFLATRRGALGVATGGVGIAATAANGAIRRFKNDPGRTDNGKLGSAIGLFASRAGRLVGLSGGRAQKGTVKDLAGKPQKAEINDKTKRFSVQKAGGGAGIYDANSHTYTLKGRDGRTQATYDESKDRMKIGDKEYAFDTSRGEVSSGSDTFTLSTGHASFKVGQDLFNVDAGGNVVKMRFNTSTNAYERTGGPTADEERTMRARRDAMEKEVIEASARRRDAQNDIRNGRDEVARLFPTSTWP